MAGSACDNIVNMRGRVGASDAYRVAGEEDGGALGLLCRTGEEQ